MKMIRNLRKWITQQCKLFTTPAYKFRVVDEVPEVIPRNVVFVVIEETIADALVFKCPCGCEEDIYLNLLPDANPCWTWTSLSGAKISIHPSVWRRVRCKSHFFIKKGKIIWV